MNQNRFGSKHIHVITIIKLKRLFIVLMTVLKKKLILFKNKIQCL